MDINKKTEILQAAAECFARYGYEKTTLDDIGRQVGLNKASLYYYYKNKESIYTEVIYTEAKEFICGIMERVGQVKSCKNKILAYFEERLTFIRHSLNLSQLSQDSAQKIAPLFRNMYGNIIEIEITQLSGILECCIEKGEIKSCESRKVALSMLTVDDAIRARVDCQLSTDEAFSAVLEEMRFTVSLILDGLAKQA